MASVASGVVLVSMSLSGHGLVDFENHVDKSMLLLSGRAPLMQLPSRAFVHVTLHDYRPANTLQLSDSIHGCWFKVLCCVRQLCCAVMGA